MLLLTVAYSNITLMYTHDFWYMISTELGVIEPGFDVIDKGCCGVGRNNGQITCLPLQTPCEDRTKYLFWDAFHPTEVANVINAKKAYNSTSSSDVYPMNIQQLALA